MKLLSALLLITLLPLLSFKAPEKSTTDLYIYLEYEQLDKENTNHLIVSDILSYDDWLKNSIEIRKKFAAKAIEQTGFEVWEASIKPQGTNESADNVRTTKEKNIQSFKAYWKKSAIHRISLNRL